MKNSSTKDKPIEKQVLKPSNNQNQNNDSFPIVGIGELAGDHEGHEKFFMNILKDSGMAFLVIHHVDPTQVGLMSELLQRKKPRNVIQATDNLKIKPELEFFSMGWHLRLLRLSSFRTSSRRLNWV